MLGIEPRNGRVLIEPDKDPEMRGTILRPQRAELRPMSGKVVAVARGISDIQIGDHVTWPVYHGTEFRVAGQELMILAAEEITSISEDFDIEEER